MSAENCVPAHNIEFAQCPCCGSDEATRISDAVVPNDSFDAAGSGVYRCKFCRTEFQFLKPIARPEESRTRPMRGGTFSPNAKCPKCGKHKTMVTSTRSYKRYHICLDSRCQCAFFTIRSEKLRE